MYCNTASTYVYEIDGLVDFGNLLSGECDHVRLSSWNSYGKLTSANGGLDLGKQEGVCLDFGNLLLIGDLPIVLSIATGVLPVNICGCISACKFEFPRV